jgi:hypothetical protein
VTAWQVPVAGEEVIASLEHEDHSFSLDGDPDIDQGALAFFHR